MNVDRETAFQFNEEDLKINREGYLSTRQVANLKRALIQEGWSLVPSLLIAVIGLVLTARLPFDRDEPVLPNLFPMMVVLVGGAMMLAMSLKFARLWQDYRRGYAEAVEGIVQLDEQLIRNLTRRYVVNISGEQFEVTQTKFTALKNGDPYRMYYAPHSRMILAVEWLNASPFE